MIVLAIMIVVMRMIVAVIVVMAVVMAVVMIVGLSHGCAAEWGNQRTGNLEQSMGTVCRIPAGEDVDLSRRDGPAIGIRLKHRR